MNDINSKRDCDGCKSLTQTESGSWTVGHCSKFNKSPGIAPSADDERAVRFVELKDGCYESS